MSGLLFPHPQIHRGQRHVLSIKRPSPALSLSSYLECSIFLCLKSGSLRKLPVIHSTNRSIHSRYTQGHSLTRIQDQSLIHSFNK